MRAAGDVCQYLHIYACVYIHTTIERANEILTAGSAEPGVNGSCSGSLCISMYTFVHAYLYMPALNLQLSSYPPVRPNRVLLGAARKQFYQCVHFYACVYIHTYIHTNIERANEILSA